MKWPSCLPNVKYVFHSDRSETKSVVDRSAGGVGKNSMGECVPYYAAVDLALSL